MLFTNDVVLVGKSLNEVYNKLNKNDKMIIKNTVEKLEPNRVH